MSGETLADFLRTQAHYCGLLGSPLYERLLASAADDLLESGPTLDVLRGHEQDPPRSNLPLRLMGAVHRLVLAGEAPELARVYPSAGGEQDLERAWPLFRQTLERLRDRIGEEIDAPVQTNEVGRCASLLGGFLTVAARTGLPLRVLEVGASAGLNLRFHRYRYESGDEGWGDPGSPVRFRDLIQGASFPWRTDTVVAEAIGCDANPLDPGSERDALTLRSFVWSDQSERFEHLSAALELARGTRAAVERSDAGEWVEHRLAAVRPDVATVVFYSMVLHYLGDATRERMLTAIEDAGARATTDAPMAWLRMELGGDEADVRLTTWPGGQERLIARAGYHGRPTRWLARH